MRTHRAVRYAAAILVLFFTTACGAVYAQNPRRYPNYPQPRGPGGYRVYQDPAFMRGYDDGYERGLDDARDGDRYDPRRDGRYRSANRGYDRRYGSRDEWRQNYRSGFTRGYDEGYRDGYRYNRNGPWRRR